MSTISLSTVFTWAFSVSVIPLFFLVRYGEGHWGFDSIGTWYTVYSAIGFALLFGASSVAVVAVTRVIRKLQRRVQRTDA
jgi:hypothetical protein